MGTTEPLEGFNRLLRSAGGRQAHCRACASAHFEANSVRHKHNVRARIAAVIRGNVVLVRSYLRLHPCVDGGEADPFVLEFDHVRGVKYKQVSRLVYNGGSWPAIEREIAEGDARCANRHRRATHTRRRSFALVAQRIEHRSSKPNVEGSTPSGGATYRR